MSNQDLKDSLQSQIVTGFWSDLLSHAQRNAVFLVDEALDLVEVAFKVATDDVASVELWIEKASLVRPTAEQIDEWTLMNDKSFRFIIVAPYVLIQEVGH